MPWGRYASTAATTALKVRRTELPSLHLNYEMVGDWRLYEQDIRSDVLIVEHPKLLSRKTTDALAEYVRRGGTLLLSGMGLNAGGETLRQVCGVAQVVGPKQAERLAVQSDGRELAFEHHLFRVSLDGAQPVISVTDQQGEQQPLLLRHEFGRGVAYYFATPLLTKHGNNKIPGPLMESVFDAVIPPSQRFVTTDAPETVEIVLRSQEANRILHLVNMDAGTRQVFDAGGRKYVNLNALPPVPDCVVRVRLDGRPKSVTLQPQNIELDNWHYQDGIVTTNSP